MVGTSRGIFSNAHHPMIREFLIDIQTYPFMEYCRYVYNTVQRDRK